MAHSESHEMQNAMQQQRDESSPPALQVLLSASSSRSVPVSRRNSFSRNASATIDQFRSALNEARDADSSPVPSPRKSASFPQLIPSSPSSPARHPTYELNCDFAQRLGSSGADPISSVAAAIANASPSDSDGDDDDELDVHEVDLSADSDSQEDIVSHEPKTRNKSLSDDLPDWLQDRPIAFSTPSSSVLAAAPAVDFAHTVQQIEHDIRHALDTAASRVSRESARRDQFQQELNRAASCPVAVETVGTKRDGYQTTGGQTETHGRQPPPPPVRLQEQNAPIPAPPELLLMMEVVIGEGRSETIEVHVGAEPHELASQFAARHALKPDAVPKLTQLIQDQLEALNLEELGFFDELPPPGEDVAADFGAKTSEHHHHQQLQSQEYLYQPELFLQPPPAPSRALPQQQQQAEELQYAASSFDIHHHQDTFAYAPPSADNDDNARFQDPPDPDAGYHKLEREHSRAMNYQSLMAKYGHYSQHSGKVNPNVAPSATNAATASSYERSGRHAGSGHPAAPSKGKDPLTLRNIQLAEHARVAMPESGRRHTLSGGSRHPSHHSASKSHKKEKAPAVFDRLYALAESKDKWIRRAQNAKQRELEKEQEQRKVEMAAKSRDLIAHRSAGGYSHIGERLYDEALSDMAKKDRIREQRAAEREYQIDWMCPKCAFVNQHNDDVCKNIVACFSATAHSGNSSMDEARARPRRESVAGGCFMDAPEVFCGQPKPDQLFHPTLLASSSAAASALNLNKERSARISSVRRQRNQQAMEDEFRQTCPFKPKINEVSEEIVRERLESDARAAEMTTTTASGELRRKDPHLALYEDSFHVRANKQAREEEHLRQFSFKPDIGVNALWINGDRSREDFVERLAVSKYQEMERKRQALHEKYAFDRDPDSGREFFKPETGRAPVFNRNERGLPIGDFLHKSHREQQEYHRRLLQQSMQELHQKRQQGFVSEASRQALAARKTKTFSRIFDALLRVSVLKSDGGAPRCPQGVDTDEVTTPAPQGFGGSLDQSSSDKPKEQQHGASAVVTPSLVQLELLPREIAQVVPIIFEFANHEPFTRDQFAAFMDKLMAEVPGLTYTQVLFLAENLNDGKSSRPTLADRHASSNSGKDDEGSEELTFHPVIDKNSSAIAKKHGRADRSKVFQALNQYFEHYKDRKMQIKKQQQREFERAHPFQPKLATKNRKQTSAGFYDKIKRMEQQHQATAASTTAATPSDAPRLHTAIANARPYVRPIENDAGEMTVALETRSSSSPSFQLLDDLGQQTGSDEDADLTSRVLAALDELPPSAQLASSSSSLALSQSSSLAMLSSSDATRNVKLLLSQADSDRVLLRSPESAHTGATYPTLSF